MGALRFVLIAITILGLAFWGLLAVVGSGLRSWYRSGAGSEELGQLAATVCPPILGALILASLFAPRSRGLLHGVAAVMVIACIGWIWGTYEDRGPMLWGLAYFAGWFLYYGLALQSAVPAR